MDLYKVIDQLKKELRDLNAVISAVESSAPGTNAARDILADCPRAICIAAPAQGPKRSWLH